MTTIQDQQLAQLTAIRAAVEKLVAAFPAAPLFMAKKQSVKAASPMPEEDVRAQCQYLLDKLPDTGLYELREFLISADVFYTLTNDWTEEKDAQMTADLLRQVQAVGVIP